MQPHDDDAEGFDGVDEFESQFEHSNATARSRGNSRAYEIRRRLEDLEERRRFHEIFEDLN